MRETAQIIAAKNRIERLRPEPGKAWMAQGVGTGPEQRAETPWIVLAHAIGPIENNVYVIVLCRRRIVNNHTQAAGHPEVHYRGTVFGREKQVFAAPLRCGEDGSAQLRWESSRHLPAQPAFAHDYIADRPSGNVRCNTATGGFYFG